MKARIPVRLTNAENKAMRQEIHKQILKNDELFSMEVDAMILWTLHIHFGFGKKRLEAFWKACFEEHKRLRDYYEMPPEDDGWLYKFKLKECLDIDIEEWYRKEVQSNGNES